MFRIFALYLLVLLFTDSAVVSVDPAANDTWTLGWFPNKPGEPDTHPFGDLVENTVTTPSSNKNDTWQKKPWFPNKPGEPDIREQVELNDVPAQINDTWKGNWFPQKIGQNDVNPVFELVTETKQPEMSTVVTAEHSLHHDAAVEITSSPAVQTKNDDNQEACDDGIKNIYIDFDPKNGTQFSSYLCQDDREFYASKYTTNPLIFEQTMPKQYVGAQHCIDTPIEYGQGIPMYGSYRPVAPQYGEYVYVPPQRWLNSMSSGAIVMLYHPCADPTQVELLKKIVTHCLRRHIISASDLPSADRPLALVAWGNRIEMSAVAQSVVVDFIRQHAQHGVPKASRRPKKRAYHLYEHMLLKPADVVSDEADAELCPNLV